MNKKDDHPLGKRRKTIVIPQTREDDTEVGYIKINGVEAIYRFNEPVSLRAKMIENLKKIVVVSREYDTIIDSNTKRAKTISKAIENPRYKVMELSKEFRDEEGGAPALTAEAKQ